MSPHQLQRMKFVCDAKRVADMALNQAFPDEQATIDRKLAVMADHAYERARHYAAQEAKEFVAKHEKAQRTRHESKQAVAIEAFHTAAQAFVRNVPVDVRRSAAYWLIGEVNAADVREKIGDPFGPIEKKTPQEQLAEIEIAKLVRQMRSQK